MSKTQGQESNQARESGPSCNAPKKNHFYALKSRGDQVSIPNVVTSMFQVFSINVYAFLDLNATLSSGYEV